MNAQNGSDPRPAQRALPSYARPEVSTISEKELMANVEALGAISVPPGP